MIHITTGWSDLGGSTVALINLTNLFNDNGIDACMYGHQTFPEGKCEYSTNRPRVKATDKVIIHFPVNPDPGYYKTLCREARKSVLSCHESNVFPIREFIKRNGRFWSETHFVSDWQKEFQDLPGTVIPNVITPLRPKPEPLPQKIGAVIGSIDNNKNTHLSIQRAIDDGCEKVVLFGRVTDIKYFQEVISPLIHQINEERGNNFLFLTTADPQTIYNSITDVYHSSYLETFNLVKYECYLAGVNYHGRDENDIVTKIPRKSEILEKWITLLK